MRQRPSSARPPTHWRPRSTGATRSRWPSTSLRPGGNCRVWRGRGGRKDTTLGLAAFAAFDLIVLRSCEAFADVCRQPVMSRGSRCLPRTRRPRPRRSRKCWTVFPKQWNSLVWGYVVVSVLLLTDMAEARGHLDLNWLGFL